MAIAHNQINKLWYNPSYTAFKKSSLVKKVFSEKDADDFLKTGAYLIEEGRTLSNQLIPWDQNKRFEILKYPRLENAFLSLGAEYLIKGVFLKKGFAINKALPNYSLNHPINLKGNKGKLNSSEVEEFGYVVNQAKNLIDFTDFDTKQKADEEKAKREMKGERLKGITRMTIPYPNSKQLLEYIWFKRNYSLHRPFIIPEFRGLTLQIFDFLNFIAQKGVGKNLKELSDLSKI